MECNAMQCNVMQCNVMYICLHIDSLTQFEMEDHLASDFVSVQKTDQGKL